MIATAGKLILRPGLSALIALITLMVIPTERGAVWANEQSDALVRAYNQSGLALFRKLADKPGNLVISPYSIGTAMAMAYSGARGKTETQMARVLKLARARAMVADANLSLNTAITKRAAKEDARITIANALHLTRLNAPVAGAYKMLLAEKFTAEVFSGSDLAAINNWVKQKSDGRIKNMLSRFDPNSVCVILNAIHFKSSWASPFAESSTGPGAFRLSAGETVEVPMMRQSGRFRVMRADTFDAIALPYKGYKLTMIVLLPRRLAEPGRVAISLDAGRADAIVDRLGGAPSAHVELSMPKFKTEFAAGLIAPFKELGMTLAFDRDRADFTGITENTKEVNRIHISQIQHKAFIDVNEAGTEAAAATAAEFATRSAAPARAVKIDRPFLYLITDAASGAILFLGRVTDPRT